MRTVVAFTATVLIAVPAAWHALGADIQSDGPATRPKAKTMKVDGVTVSVELDRGVLVAGGTLKATLVATSETPKKISLDVRAMEDMGYGEERVENPPQQVGKRRITIEATPDGGKPVEVAFKLGARGKKGVVNWYDLEVTKAGMKRDDASFWADEEDGPPSAARIGAATWSGNTYPLAIELPATIPANKEFTVAVRVTNTTKKPIDWFEIELGGRSLSYGGMEGQLYARTDEDPYEVVRADDDYSDEPLKPGESRVAKFKVTPTEAAEPIKDFTLVAHAHGAGGGALETVSFKPTETPPAAVATK
ncbi:MAG: hypothetical protein ABI175_25635 [Polyangiales bacterium]